MPRISIPTALRQYAGGQASVEVQGAKIGEALARLTAQYPDLRKHLFDAKGKLRSFVNVYVNDEDIRYLQHEETRDQGERRDQHHPFDRRRRGRPRLKMSNRPPCPS